MNLTELEAIMPKWGEVEKEEITIKVDKELAEFLSKKPGNKKIVEELIYVLLKRDVNERLIGENIPTFGTVEQEEEYQLKGE
jgi:hypothetical protein